MADAPIVARLPLPHLIVRGQDTLLACPLYRGRSLVEVTEGSVVVTAPRGEVSSGAVVPSPEGVAEYTVLAADTDGETPADAGWYVDWTLTTADEVVVVRSTAAFIRTRLRPVVAAVDLYRRVPALDPDGPAPIVRDDGDTDHQWAIDESWLEVQSRLLEQGTKPWLILNPSALRRAHLYLALSIVFDDLASRVGEAYRDDADKYRRLHDAAWDDLDLEYDTNRDGKVDDNRGGSASVWLL